MGLGRTTRFAPLPPGARRVSVMRAGTAGIKVLAPSADLLRDFMASKRALVRGGMPSDRAHAAAHRAVDYVRRYRAELAARPGAMPALRRLVQEARTTDVYLMCMCAYRTRGRACHTYALLDLARELDPRVRPLPEPAPRRRGRAGRLARPQLARARPRRVRRPRRSKGPGTPGTRTTRGGAGT